MSELIDREALLDECLNHYEVGNIEQNCTMDWICKTVRNFPAASPWHRVEEPPKEEYRTYLVYTDTGYMCSCRWTNNMYGLGESDRWGWSIADVPQFQKVTHWMPIEPPKEDA